MSAPLGSPGILGVVVWPTYVGASSGDPGANTVPLGEPFGDINYQRGQIIWETRPDGMILGRAQVYAPKGVWTHFLFCHGPGPDLLIGFRPLEQPIVFDRPGVIDVDPIHNRDYLPRL